MSSYVGDMPLLDLRGLSLDPGGLIVNLKRPTLKSSSPGLGQVAKRRRGGLAVTWPLRAQSSSTYPWFMMGWRCGMRYVLKVLALLLGLALGLVWPDLDLKVSFLLHRSALTHSALLPLFLFWPARKKWRAVLTPFVIGVCTSLAVHFCFDLFPGHWIGFSLISVPFIGRFGAVMSWLWLSLSIVVCLYLAFLLADDLLGVVFAVGGVLLAYSYCAVREIHDGLALVTLIVAGVIALLLPANPVLTLWVVINGGKYRSVIARRENEI